MLALRHRREPVSACRQSVDLRSAVEWLARRHDLGPLGEFLGLQRAIAKQRTGLLSASLHSRRPTTSTGCRRRADANVGFPGSISRGPLAAVGGSRKAAEHAFETTKRYLESELKLQVNPDKSGVAPANR